jgi:hypothetical protein
MPLKPSHNLLVRGSNPCGGTKTLLIADCQFFTSQVFFKLRQTHYGAKMARLFGVRRLDAGLLFSEPKKAAIDMPAELILST